MEKINEIKTAFAEKINAVTNLSEANDLRVEFFGKKGHIADLMKLMREVEDKKAFGQSVNDLKQELMSEFEKVQSILEAQAMDAKLMDDCIDVTAPSRKQNRGTQSILLQTAREIETIFTELGFEIAIGQEVESDYHNFEALNLGKDHPARDMQDTFYLDPQTLLRTHTSNIQSRVLSSNDNQELKIICPGKVYRRDDDDATHSHQFMQTEGLVVVRKGADTTASLQDLKTVLSIFVNRIFNRDDLDVRFRPSFFPFTEPSVEVDITCSSCSGSGCAFCKQTGWIEVLGAGVIHQNVLAKAGYDAEEFTGFAFGIGVERIALLKHNIEDIRNLYQNDLRFIKQFD